MENYIPMYNENDNPDLTGTESENIENNDNSSGTYGGSFKNYTYSTYDYSSFYDENYSNSYDKVNNTTDDSFETFDILENVNSNNQKPSSKNSDATVYLDEFLQEAVNYNNSLSKSQKRQNKFKTVNILGIISVIAVILAFIFFYITPFTSGEISHILNKISMSIFFAAFILLFITVIFTKKEDSVFSKYNPDFLKEKLNFQYIQNYLKLTGKTTFIAAKPYCLTGPYSNDKHKTSTIKHIIFAILITFVIGNIIAYIKCGPVLSHILLLDAILFFPCLGICFLFNSLEDYLQINGGYYNETVDAVCIEIETKITTSNDLEQHKEKVYRPILYTRCSNGHKYILFEGTLTNSPIPYIGEVMKLKVNSDNPLCYVNLKSKHTDLFLWFSIIWMIVSSLIYIYLLINFKF